LPIFGIPALILLLKRKGEFEEKEEEKENADAYYKRGDFYYEVGPYGQVIAHYYEVGPYSQVIADYSKAIELDPNSALTYYIRGLAYREKGEMPKAVSDLEKCVGLSSDRELTKSAQQALSEIKNSP
jgi:tetratricopeptide (TPR) repeat protein